MEKAQHVAEALLERISAIKVLDPDYSQVGCLTRHQRDPLERFLADRVDILVSVRDQRPVWD